VYRIDTVSSPDDGHIYFNFSTCFGQLCAHHQQNLLYLCDTGIFHSVWVAVWSADQSLSQNFLGVTGKNDKINLNQDTQIPGLNPSRYITLMTVINLWACQSVQTQGESKHNFSFHLICQATVATKQYSLSCLTIII